MAGAGTQGARERLNLGEEERLPPGAGSLSSNILRNAMGDATVLFSSTQPTLADP